MSEDLQRTDKWRNDRSGKFTASVFADVMARNKKTGEPLKAFHDIVWQVVTERMTQQPTDGPQGFALQWGIDVEPYAREAYEMETGSLVIESEFVTHPEFAFAGCSPDGLVGAHGGLEMKCPKNPRIHLERFIDGVPDEYMPQIQGCMWVTGRKWWDFVSYDPRMPERYRLLKIRVERDQEFINRLQEAVIYAEECAMELTSKLNGAVTEQPEAADIARTIIDSAPDIAKRSAAPESEKLHTTTIVIEHWYSDGLVLANLKQLLEERGFPVKSVRVAEQEVEA